MLKYMTFALIAVFSVALFSAFVPATASAGCIGSCGNNQQGGIYVNPAPYMPGNAYNYGYVAPYRYSVPGYAYNYNYNSNYAYVPPSVYAQPYNRGFGWGSFGTYDNWARAFFSQHGRWPNAQDEADYWWSQQFAAQTGFSPYGQ